MALVPMKISTKWLVLWTLWACRVVRQPTIPVETTSGLVRGVVSIDGSIHQYFGTPYAIEPLRFQKPGPEPKWDGVYDAINENIRCHQSVLDLYVVGQTNCLVLNIHTPSTPHNDNLPVMVFIHGGAFYKGSGTAVVYGPNYLVPKGVILVTTNYRLSALGFMCLGIKEAPGNAALKDQVAALRWVQRNIRNFGGDPHNVTLFGGSAGGASVSYHLYSPMSKGLFHKAITQSGSALAAWVMQFEPLHTASSLAKTMLYESQNPYELYKYFMTKTEYELTLIRPQRPKNASIYSEIMFSPCVEKQIDDEEAFLTEEPFELLLRGDFNKVPLIIGSNIEEGLLLLALDNDTTIYDVKIADSLPSNLEIPSQKEKTVVVKEFESLFMGRDGQ